VVLFDNNVLCLLLHPDAEIPNDPATDKVLDRAADRIRFLVEQLQEDGVRIIIPTPVLMEFLTFATADYLTEINQSMWFDVQPFDQRAAIEAAVALRRALGPGGHGKTLRIPGAKWQKIKVDRQIVAIGKVHKVSAVYSTDAGLLTLARESGLKALHAADLPVPPVAKVQISLDELLAAEPVATSPASTVPQSPSEQSPGVSQPKAPEPEQDRPLNPPDAPSQQRPDSSQTAPPRPPSEK
jgi:predicted nucleic acid-binding protein